MPRIQMETSPFSLVQGRSPAAQAVSNVCAIAKGGEVDVATWHRADEAGIDVLDRGPGIPETEIERLKRPFTRLEAARSNAGGTGLGLAIAERMARLHGGRLDLLPRPGGGLIARLRLPCAAAD